MVRRNDFCDPTWSCGTVNEPDDDPVSKADAGIDKFMGVENVGVMRREKGGVPPCQLMVSGSHSVGELYEKLKALAKRGWRRIENVKAGSSIRSE
jgi:hypothetical protein